MSNNRHVQLVANGREMRAIVPEDRGLTSKIEPCMMQQGKLRPLHTEHVLTGYDLSLATREIPSSAKIVGISSVFIATGIPISVGADSN